MCFVKGFANYIKYVPNIDNLFSSHPNVKQSIKASGYFNDFLLHCSSIKNCYQKHFFFMHVMCLICMGENEENSKKHWYKWKCSRKKWEWLRKWFYVPLFRNRSSYQTGLQSCNISTQPFITLYCVNASILKCFAIRKRTLQIIIGYVYIWQAMNFFRRKWKDQKGYCRRCSTSLCSEDC